MADTTPNEPVDLTGITDPAELLALVRDVHVPEASWWPAPGWWLLAILFAVCVYGIYRLLRLRRAYRLDAWRREARAELKTLSSTLETADVSERHEVVKRASSLLRQVMMAVHGREGVASLTDDSWLRALDAQENAEPLGEGLRRLLTDVPYQPVGDVSATPKKVSALLNWIARYVDQLPAVTDAKVKS